MTDANPQGNPAPQDGAAPEAVATPTVEGANAAPAADPNLAPAAELKAPEAQQDWRDLAAGGDAKERARLERFASPQDFYKSYRALEQRLSSGELKKALPENATPEQITEWRKDNGIPESPEGYDTTLPDGLVIGENDKPLVNEFLKAMHGANASPTAVKAALSAYYNIVADQQADWVNKSDAVKAETEETLRAEWGPDYRKNLNLALSTLDMLGAEAKQAILNAQGADAMLMNNPHVLRGLATLAREINPAGTLLPSGNGDPMQGVETELAAIAQKRKEDRAGYFKDTAMQARERELIEARDKLRSRSA